MTILPDPTCRESLDRSPAHGRRVLPALAARARQLEEHALAQRPRARAELADAAALEEEVDQHRRCRHENDALGVHAAELGPSGGPDPEDGVPPLRALRRLDGDAMDADRLSALSAARHDHQAAARA